MIMNKVKFILMAIVASVLVSCGTTSTVPVTGRKHKLSVTDEYMLSLSSQQYAQYMKQAKPSTNATNTALVKKVGQRLATAVENYLRNNGFAHEVNNFAWEFNLVADNQVNAFCMPGGKIVVYEGLLPVTQNEASLAIVLGHEIAHAVAKPSAEQMTKSSNSTQGLSLLSLKYSRDNESEADYMGLVFAALAGYDPQVAISFWQRMASGNSSQTATWMSSHPSDEKRIADIQKHMPEALAYYKAAGGTPTSTTTTKTIKASSLTKKKK